MQVNCRSVQDELHVVLPSFNYYSRENLCFVFNENLTLTLFELLKAASKKNEQKVTTEQLRTERTS